MKRLSLIALTIIIGASIGCEKANFYPTSRDANPETSISAIEIGKGELYGNGSEGISQQNLVITDSIAWDALKNQMNSVHDVSSEFSEQYIDFTQWMVLVSFDPIRSSDGFEIWFSSIQENANNITATIHNSSPLEFANMVLTQPFHIVKIPVSPKPIVFN